MTICLHDMLMYDEFNWNNMNVYEPQQNLGRGLCTGKTGLSLPHPVINHWPFPCGAFVLVLIFQLLVFIRFFFVFDFLFILCRIASWPFAGKELFSWLSICAVFSLCRLNYFYSFPVWCLGQDVEFYCIDSWSLPFQLLWILLRKSLLWYLSRRGYPASYSKEGKVGALLLSNLPRWELCCRGRKGPGTCKEGSLVYLVSQRLLGKLRSFHTFYVVFLYY